MKKDNWSGLDDWSLSLGTYTGICVGFRSYVESTKTNHVLYLPFVDVCLTIYKN